MHAEVNDVVYSMPYLYNTDISRAGCTARRTAFWSTVEWDSIRCKKRKLFLIIRVHSQHECGALDCFVDVFTVLLIRDCELTFVNAIFEAVPQCITARTETSITCGKLPKYHKKGSWVSTFWLNFSLALTHTQKYLLVCPCPVPARLAIHSEESSWLVE